MSQTFLYQVALFLFIGLAACNPPNKSCQEALQIFGGDYTCPTQDIFAASDLEVYYKLESSSNKNLMVRITYDDITPANTPSLEAQFFSSQKANPNWPTFIDFKKTKDISFTVFSLEENGLLSNLIGKQYNSVDNLFKDPKRFLLLFKGILQGVQALHTAGFVHRDLRPENIFLGADLVPKVGNLYFIQQSGSQSGSNILSVYVDPIVWFAKGPIRQGPALDIYSLGIILYEMAHNHLNPFEDTTTQGFKARLQSGMYSLSEGTDQLVALLIARCLTSNTGGRFEISEMIRLINDYVAAETFKKITHHSLQTWRVMKLEDFQIIGEKKKANDAGSDANIENGQGGLAVNVKNVIADPKPIGQNALNFGGIGAKPVILKPYIPNIYGEIGKNGFQRFLGEVAAPESNDQLAGKAADQEGSQSGENVVILFISILASFALVFLVVKTWVESQVGSQSEAAAVKSSAPKAHVSDSREMTFCA